MKNKLIPGDLVRPKKDYFNASVLLTRYPFDVSSPQVVVAHFKIDDVGIVVSTDGRHNEYVFVVCSSGSGWTFSEYMIIDQRS